MTNSTTNIGASNSLMEVFIREQMRAMGVEHYTLSSFSIKHEQTFDEPIRVMADNEFVVVMNYVFDPSITSPELLVEAENAVLIQFFTESSYEITHWNYKLFTGYIDFRLYGNTTLECMRIRPIRWKGGKLCSC